MFKIKNILLLLIGFIFANAIIYIQTEQNKNERITLSLDTHLEKLQTHFSILRSQQKLSADGAYYSTIASKKAINILTKALKTNDIETRDKLRNELYELLKNKYERLKVKGILQYHFVFPDNTVFLRFHKPDKYGDSLLGVRDDFVYTNRTHKKIVGFAQGKTAHAFRHVYPIFNGKEYIGAVEISFSSDGLQENFTTISKMHTHFLVNKNIFDSNVWERDDLILKYNQSAEHENLMIAMTNKHTKQKCITNHKIILDTVRYQLDSNILKDKKFSFYIKSNEAAVISSFIPILSNTSNKVLAWIAAYENNKFIAITLQDTLYIRIIMFIVLAILFLSIYINLNKKELFKKRVEEKTLELKMINENLENKIKQEVQKSKKIEKQLFNSEKMASMGEMIGNIAHQWRQPLSVISTSATGMLMQKEYGLLDDDKIEKTCEMINDNAQYLSKTIDDFKNFIKGDRKEEYFNLKEDVDIFLHLVEGSIKAHNINIIFNLQEDIVLNGYPNELVQCFINIFNNAKDALEDKSVKKLFFISTYTKDDEIIIEFKDNANGIQEDMISKIFEPYFTTKHKSKGTGLGLHMTYNFINEGMKGSIQVENETYTYEDIEYKGAKFKITLPV